MGDQQVPGSPATPLATLLGGESVAVVYRSGEKAEVFVRQLPVRLIGKWAQLDSAGTPESEAALVELYCALPEGGSDALTVESYEAVLARGEALNRPTFARWQRRATDRAREWVAANAEVQGLRRELEPTPSPTPAPGSASSSDGSRPT